MKLFPPRSFINGKVSEMKRYGARVHDRLGGNLLLNCWEYLGHKKFSEKEFICTIFIDHNNVTVGKRESHGIIYKWSPVDIWTWKETRKDGKVYDRLHVAKMI